MTNQAHILMCPPDFYGIEYEINPWMNRQRQVDHALATEQWQALRKMLIETGANVSLMTPVEGLPDLVFTANAAMIFQKNAILSNFRYPQRQGEQQHDATWLESAGINILRLDAEFNFEGAGDSLFCGDTLFAGYRLRSDARGHQKIAEMIKRRVIPLELIDPYYYHLDTCFCPLSTNRAAYYPGAFDEYGRKVLGELIEHLIEVDAAEAQSFACNAVVVGRTVITNSGCPQFHEQLTAAGFQPQETPLSEFVKAGGSAKCLTLRLDGEDAAQWRIAADNEGCGNS